MRNEEINRAVIPTRSTYNSINIKQTITIKNI